MIAATEVQLALAELAVAPLARAGDAIDEINLRDPAIADLLMLLLIAPVTAGELAPGAHWAAPGYLRRLEVGFRSLARAGLPIAIAMHDVAAMRIRLQCGEGAH